MEEKDNFEQWHDAGHKYAADHPELGMWEFQVVRMASNFAWRMEGMEITDENVQLAYDDWISGQSPYSVHSLATPRSREEGYDFTEAYRRDCVKAKEKTYDFALSMGLDPREAVRFCDAVEMNNYFDEYKAKGEYKDWMTGKNPKSPHHVPLDPENKTLRDSRVTEMRLKYSGKEGTISELLYFDSVFPPYRYEMYREKYPDQY